MSETDGTDNGRTRGTHPVDVGHLVMGVAFLGLTAVWGVLAADLLRLEDARWLLPLPWLAAGAAGLIATVLRRRPEPAAEDRTEWKSEYKQEMADWKADYKREMKTWSQDVKRHAQDWHRPHDG